MGGLYFYCLKYDFFEKKCKAQIHDKSRLFMVNFEKLWENRNEIPKIL